MVDWSFCFVLAVSVILARWLPFIAWHSLLKRPDKPELAGWPCSKCKGERMGEQAVFRWNICCKERFSALQAGVQVAAGLAVVPLSLERGVAVETWIHLLLIYYLIILTLTDYWAGLIPNLFTYSGAGLFFLLRILFHARPFINYLFAFLVAFGGLLFIGWVTRGLGGGDAKLLAMAAWVIGWPHVLTAFWFATASASLYVVWKAFRRQPVRAGEPFPFGPHLALGAYLASLWGETLLKWYLSLFVPI